MIDVVGRVQCGTVECLYAAHHQGPEVAMVVPAAETPVRILVSTEEMAALLGIPPKKLKTLACRGLVPRLILGHRSHLYDPEAVVEALKKNFGTTELSTP